ncbi:LacI family DNA-binding transcriptional regulator [Metabacillus litoralis]|uniref:LacI family DNA-binding transcriptional regulator n=1 Tax=Metabacillus litoralis TaxID=152268 RepID=UPI00203C8373|nr:LacI family DNA-binding transcriptional regulator [Metabacillus litoralis]MCM3655434.1 LacI family DNA-binding transcriptional regulator [Metabacillus litoralis]
MQRKKRSRVTLQQVAEHAGVSRATASLIVRDSPNISEKTRKKVLESMRELGYVYDRVAANLRSQRSSTVGIIITDIANTFFSELLIGVHHALEKEGYTVLLGTTFDSDSKQDRLLSTMLEHRVGGVILCPVSATSKETIDRIKKLDIPIVLAVRELAEANCDYVGVNYRDGAELAVNHLILKGHRRIAFLGGRSESSTWKERFEGYGLALHKAGIEIDTSLVVDSAPTRDGGMEAVQQVLSQPNPPTAAFCFSDLVAFGVMLGLRDVGLTPGQDMAVVGFDNVPEADVVNPPLTSVSSFARQIGSNAANLLHQRILDFEREHQRIILNPELIERDSSFVFRKK